MVFSHYTEQNVNSLEFGLRVSAIDTCKVFDTGTVKHGIVVTRLLNNTGIRGHIYEWSKSYLRGRSHYLTVCDAFSTFSVISAGVTLECVEPNSVSNILYINDLVRLKLNSKIYSFTDNMALNQGIRDINECMLCHQLQLNPNKCKVMFFGINLPITGHLRCACIFINTGISFSKFIIKMKIKLQDILM